MNQQQMDLWPEETARAREQLRQLEVVHATTRAQCVAFLRKYDRIRLVDAACILGMSAAAMVRAHQAGQLGDLHPTGADKHDTMWPAIRVAEAAGLLWEVMQ